MNRECYVVGGVVVEGESAVGMGHRVQGAARIGHQESGDRSIIPVVARGGGVAHRPCGREIDYKEPRDGSDED